CGGAEGTDRLVRSPSVTRATSPRRADATAAFAHCTGAHPTGRGGRGAPAPEGGPHSVERPGRRSAGPPTGVRVAPLRVARWRTPLLERARRARSRYPCPRAFACRVLWRRDNGGA